MDAVLDQHAAPGGIPLVVDVEAAPAVGQRTVVDLAAPARHDAARIGHCHGIDTAQGFFQPDSDQPHQLIGRSDTLRLPDQCNRFDVHGQDRNPAARTLTALQPLPDPVDQHQRTTCVIAPGDRAGGGDFDRYM